MPVVFEPGLGLVEDDVRLQHLEEETDLPVKDQSTPPYEGFSERVTDGSDDDRQTAYGRWLKRLRGNQGRRSDKQKDVSKEDKA